MFSVWRSALRFSFGISFIGLVLTSFSPHPLTAQEPVLEWERLLPGAEAAHEVAIAARLLPDGTIVVVFPSTISRLEAGSNTPTVSPLSAPYGVAQAAIDDCGNVVVTAFQGSVDTSDVWVMKFDSRDGRALWDAPLVWNSGGAMPDQPDAVAFDESSDVLVVVRIVTPSTASVLKIGGPEGNLLWASSAVPGVAQGSAVAVAGGDLMVVAPATTPAVSFAWSVEGSTGALGWGPVSLAIPTSTARHLALTDTSGKFLVLRGADPDTVLAALDAASGSILWGPLRRPIDAATSASLATDGALVVGGATTGRYTVARLDTATGNILNNRAIDTSQPSGHIELSPAPGGDVFATANFTGIASLRVGRDGAIVWGPVFRSPAASERPRNLVDNDGNLIEIYRSNPQAPFGTELAVRQGSDGATVGTPIDLGAVPVHNRLIESAFLSNGDVIVGSSVTEAPPGHRAFVRRVHRSTGSTLWSQEFANDPLLGIATDPADDVIVLIGQTSGTLYKLDGSDGSIIWGPVAPFGLLFRNIVADSAGNIFVTSAPLGGVSVTKHSGTDGSTMWGSTLPGVGFPVNLAIDSSDDVVGTSGSGNWATWKLDGTTGTILWGPVVYDRQGGFDFPRNLSVLPSGDVVVAGTTEVSGGETEITIFRYAGASGVGVWGPVHQGGTANTQAAPFGIAIDGSGNVFLAGTAVNTTTGEDTVVLKLQGSNGALMWGPVEFTSNTDFDLGGAIAVDAAGNAIVASSASDPSGDEDIILFALDGTNGSTVWGPIQEGDFAADGSAELSVGSDDILLVGYSQRFGMSFNPVPLLRSYRFDLGIRSGPDILAICGAPVNESLDAVNASGAVTFSLVVGALPEGVTLSPAGLLSGTPEEVGVFPITVEVTDSSLATATRDVTIVVREADVIPIAAADQGDCQLELSVPGSWASHLWEPGGETTATIVVSPLHDTLYGVTVADGAGCTMRGSILVRATRLIDPDCGAPGLTSIAPTSGPPGTDLTVTGAGFEAGSQARVGGMPETATFQDTSTLVVTTDNAQPGTLNSLLVSNSNGGNAVLYDAFLADFLDVPQGHLFHDFVEALVRSRVTAGCGSGFYCPDNSVSRAQMAVFLLTSLNGPGFVPPPATGTVFNDVAPTDFAAAFIEALAAAQVTAGCGGGNYCPNDSVTREQMAVFLLRTLEGPTYTPPACTMPTFSDVPCSSPFARWIEELVERDITAGCGAGNFCPTDAVTRGQMAVFLTVTFGLP
jgi:hypothetical protein